MSSLFPHLAQDMVFDREDKIKAFYLCQTILEPIRASLNGQYQQVTVHITSGKRSQAMFEALRKANYQPSPTSDHAWHGFSVACDFVCKVEGTYHREATKKAFMDIDMFFAKAFGQLIYYPDKGHIHVSLPSPKHWGESWTQS